MGAGMVRTGMGDEGGFLYGSDDVGVGWNGGW